jgi:hypothetical protein
MELSMDEEAAGLASVAPRARASSGFLASAISPSLARNKVRRTLHNQPGNCAGCNGKRAPLYSDMGLSSIDPEQMIPMLIVGYGYGI